MRKFMNEKVPNGICFSMMGNTLHLTLCKNSLIKNMQTDCSAFEAWAICLKAKYYQKISKVQVDWNPLDKDELSPSELGHYYRALYRLYKFSQNFPTWAIISPAVPVSFIQEMSKWVLNYPSKGCSKSNKNKANAEAKLERELVQVIYDKFEVGDEQLPVGLFLESVSKESSRSPRGLSQIDLWSINKEILSIYELKNDENVAAGIISELLLYTNVMTDFVTHIFNYPKSFDNKRKSHRHSKEFYEKIKSGSIKQIEGVMLADKIHPLITPETISLLNTNSNLVHYSQCTISEFKTR